jgi:hypothetical protein
MTPKPIGGLARARKGEAGTVETFVFLIGLMAAGGVLAAKLSERSAEYSPERIEAIRKNDKNKRVEAQRDNFNRWAMAALDYEGYIACREYYSWATQGQICGPAPYQPWELDNPIDINSEEFRALAMEQDPKKRRVFEVFMTWQNREDRDDVRPDASILIQHEYEWTDPSVMEAILAMPGAVGGVVNQQVVGGLGQTTYEWGKWGRRIE